MTHMRGYSTGGKGTPTSRTPVEIIRVTNPYGANWSTTTAPPHVYGERIWREVLVPDEPKGQLPSPGSVSQLIPGLKDGDRHAMQKLWERYFQPMVRLARGRVPPARRRHAGSEDVALEAFLEFCENVARPDNDRRFPQLQTREQVWKLLACFTIRTAFDINQKQARRERVVRGESALGEEGFATFAGREPAPEFAAAVSELLDDLQDETLRTVARRKMEGCTVPEIARELDCSTSTVERKLRAIRAIWKTREKGSP
jgi:DNA-directed RNA polymerase specialized sigma24 family protein